MLDLEPIKARAKGITPGTWFIEDNMVMNETRSHTMVLLPSEANDEHDAANAEFIAHARTDVPALIAEVEEQRETIVRLVDQIQTHAADRTGMQARDEAGRRALCKHERATFHRMVDAEVCAYKCDDCGWIHKTVVDPFGCIVEVDA